MKDGNDTLEDVLNKAECDANNLERILPHISDELRTLVKYIKAYDKNQKKLIQYMVDTQRRVKVWQGTLELMATYLTPVQSRFVKRYMNKLKKEVTEDDSSRTNNDAC